MNSSIKSFLLLIVMPVLAGILSMWGLLRQTGVGQYWESLADAAISCIWLVVFAWLLNTILRFYRPTNGREWMLVVWIFIFSILWLILSWVPQVFYHSETEYGNLVRSTFWLRFFLANLLLGCTSLIAWVRSNTLSEYQSQKRLNEIQKLARQTELNSIRQQLQPHFLFNSLNSIYALIGKDPDKARTMVRQLSDFLRGTLRRDAAQLADLDEELLHTRLYLEIEKVRFPRLEVNWSIGELPSGLKMPVMLLQPAVENAIKFGLYDTIGTVNIDIQVACEGNNLILGIGNPFDPATEQVSRGTGFGLDSIRRRLFLLFGRQDLLQTKTENQYFHLQITIPQNQ